MELTAKQLAKRLGVHPQTLRRWRSHGTGPKYKKKGPYEKSPVVYALKDVIRFEKQNSIKTRV